MYAHLEELLSASSFVSVVAKQDNIGLAARSCRQNYSEIYLFQYANILVSKIRS